MVQDALGREWQLGTVQLDYNLPERFDLTYTDEHDERQRPVMIHRAPFGSLERFIGVMLEHTGGNLPLWLAPVQVQVLPITDRQNDYAEQTAETLRRSGLRVAVDTRSEKVGRKIRDAEVDKVPVMLVVGQTEAEAGTVSVRRHGLGGRVRPRRPDRGRAPRRAGGGDRRAAGARVAASKDRPSRPSEGTPPAFPTGAGGRPPLRWWATAARRAEVAVASSPCAGGRPPPAGVYPRAARGGRPPAERATGGRTGTRPPPRTPPAPPTRRGRTRRRRPSAPGPSGRGARA